MSENDEVKPDAVVGGADSPFVQSLKEGNKVADAVAENYAAAIAAGLGRPIDVPAHLIGEPADRPDRWAMPMQDVRSTADPVSEDVRKYEDVMFGPHAAFCRSAEPSADLKAAIESARAGDVRASGVPGVVPGEDNTAAIQAVLDGGVYALRIEGPYAIRGRPANPPEVEAAAGVDGPGPGDWIDVTVRVPRAVGEHMQKINEAIDVRKVVQGAQEAAFRNGTFPGLAFPDAKPDDGPSFARWTDRARKVMQLARQEAAYHNHAEVEPLHVLLGVVKHGQGVAAAALIRAGLRLPDAIRPVREAIVAAGYKTVEQVVFQLPLSAECQQVVRNANVEAARLDAQYVGTEHVLLALVTHPATYDVLARLLPCEPGRLTDHVRALLAGAVSQEGVNAVDLDRMREWYRSTYKGPPRRECRVMTLRPGMEHRPAGVPVPQGVSLVGRVVEVVDVHAADEPPPVLRRGRVEDVIALAEQIGQCSRQHAHVILSDLQTGRLFTVPAGDCRLPPTPAE